MKVPNNKLSSLKSYFFESLESINREEVKRYFSFLCNAWLGLSKTDLIINPDREISESEILKFLYGIKDLKKNRPIQYVAGKTWFYGLELKVDEGVLIPRPETEELVDWIVRDCRESKKLLDIGTGSGCIPLSVKSKLENLEVFGYDFSKQALETAEANANSLGLVVNFEEFDILNWKSYVSPDVFDVIVSNPPYIPESDKALMHENVLEYEPEMALFVPNENPLVFYKSIVDYAVFNLARPGKLFLEIHESFGREVIQLFNDVKNCSVELRKDLQGKDRMIKVLFHR